MKWSKTFENINPETHKLLNGRILVRMPCIREEDFLSEGSKLVLDAVSTKDSIPKLQREMIKGELVKVSSTAFPKDGEDKPKIGDMVFFYPYAGNIYLTDDEYLYRNMSYKDLTGFEKQ